MQKEGIERLRFAIIEQSMTDYINSLVQKKQLEEKLFQANKMINECENFFNSDWCAELMGNQIGADKIMEVGHLRSEYALWKLKKRCSKCKHEKCIHRFKERYDATENGKWVCEKDGI